ncbi:ABC transporter substrate-binding protein [Mycolicibacterium sp. 624]|uniref:peptide ABC transporter substrate-binding protein n=1 Tax=Mycolicibacterium sp. 624 TaxID=3156314 RepID=UPI003395BE3E
MRRLVGLVIAVIGISAAAACGGGGSGEASSGEVSVAILEPSSLMPANYSEVYGSQVVTSLFTPLVTFDPGTNETRLGVASEINSADSQHWDVNIAPGWTFHNGEPVTASSFVDAWNFNANRDAAQLNSYVFDNIQGYDEVSSGQAPAMSGLQVIDDHSFRIDLKTPDSQFEIMLGYPAFSPLPTAAFKDPNAFERSPIGNGPFKMNGEWVHDQEIQLIRFDEYAGSPAKAKSLTYRIYQSFDTAYNDLVSGGVDIVPGIPASKVEEARRILGENYEEFNSGRLEYLGFPLASPQFGSADVRRAISMAIDRQAVSNVVFAGTREPATGYVPSLVPGAATDACGQACTHDPEAAKRLFNQAAGDRIRDGFSIAYSTDSPDNKPWVEAVARQLSDTLGIQVTPKPYPTLAVVLEKLGNGSVDSAFRTAWTFYYPSIGNYLDPIFGATSPENFSGYQNPSFEKKLAEARGSASADQARDLYLQAEQIVLDDMPYVPLWTQRIPVGTSQHVSDVHMDAFRRIHVEDIALN